MEHWLKIVPSEFYFPIQKVKALYYKGFQLFGQQLGNKIANIKGKCSTKKGKNID